MTNGQHVAALEAAWAERVGARYALALDNGTNTLVAALHVLGVRGKDVVVPALTMSSTAIAVLHAGGTPCYADVDPATLLMLGTRDRPMAIPVDLYGLHYHHGYIAGPRIDDAAQCLRPHDPQALFTSYSLQASKIVSSGEGGVLVTNDEDLAMRARSYSSLGYRMAADQPRIDPAAIKEPTFVRHHTLGQNYRMADAVAQLALKQLKRADALLRVRSDCASMYRTAINGCKWLRPQAGAPGQQHDYWAYAVVMESSARFGALVAAMVRHGGERPYACWLPPYREPALLAAARCPNADSLQPRILQFQTNDLQAAERNARALMAAIAEVG